MIEPVLVLAWLLFAHLLADFVLQNDWIAMNKGTGGRRGWSALLAHGAHVGLCLIPVAIAFGLRGIGFVVVVAVSHVLVDRWKVAATRRAEVSAQAAARQRVAAGGVPAPSGLGAAWTPWPGILFIADQVLHLAFSLVAWLVLLEGASLTEPFVRFADAVLRDWDRGVVHATILTAVVLVSVLIVNTRGAYYFILALVSPREIAPAPAASSSSAAAQGYTVRVGPLVATVEPGVAAVPGAAGSSGTPGSPAVTPAAPGTPGGGPPPPSVQSSVPTGAPARIGATIGALERLLIVAFVLTRAEAAIGLVVAAKTIARFRQLDDRGFAEYYLLGTLASVAVAVATGLLAAAALGTLG